MKKVLSVLCSLMMAFAFGLNAFAADSEKNICIGLGFPESGTQYEYNPNARYVPECGKYPTHDMLSKAWGSLYNVTTNQYVYSNGTCWQCTRCNLVLTTQNEPESAAGLGYYSYWQADDPLSSFLTTIYNDSAHIYYTTDNTLPGITFRYSAM